jgi:hypothetical protein
VAEESTPWWYSRRPRPEERPGPWWYSRRPRRTLIIGIGVLVLCLLRIAADGPALTAVLLGAVGVFQLGSGVLSVRRDARAELEQPPT